MAVGRGLAVGRRVAVAAAGNLGQEEKQTPYREEVLLYQSLAQSH